MDGEARGSRAQVTGHSSSNPVEPSETVITVGFAGGECCDVGDGDLKSSMPGAAPEGGKASVEQLKRGVEAGADVVPETDKGAFVVVDLKGASGKGSDGGGDRDSEKVCRICHLSQDCQQSEGSDLIQLGCGCKDELGIAHRHCAEAWFKLKGNSCCEICGVCAKNITGVEDIRFMEEWNERRMLSSSNNNNNSEGDRCWRGQQFCNFLLACLVIAFILPWFFRVYMF